MPDWQVAAIVNDGGDRFWCLWLLRRDVSMLMLLSIARGGLSDEGLKPYPYSAILPQVDTSKYVVV
jgi:hypothetical protein